MTTLLGADLGLLVLVLLVVLPWARGFWEYLLTRATLVGQVCDRRYGAGMGIFA
jgi:hypothetical protein